MGQYAAVVVGGIVRALMQGQIVKHGHNSLLLQMGDQGSAFLERRAYQIKHMRIVAGVGRDVRQLKFALLGRSGQSGEIIVPQRFAFGLDGIQVFELGP